ncbi:uncharacterized protein LOC144941087 isoform X2 [Lampetra fluviatilis]
MATRGLSLTELSSGNPVYEKYYRLVDPGNTGQVGAAQAVVFLKKSGLPDLTLGKIWEVADPEGKGYLEKQGFYVALRLVACAQNALNVSLSSLDFPVPVPKFELDSPAMIAPPQGPDIPWAVKPEEKAKFDSIYDSLKPQNGLLSGEKVKPVLLNSKLPVETLGRVWDLSDIDRDGFLDRDEFSVAMYLVYRALEKEPVPLALPIKLIPPAKRKPGLVSSAFALPKSQAVSAAERLKYDEMFTKLDKDGDGQVTGLEVKEVFMKTGLSPAVLAQIWALSDTRQCGKLTRDQFGMAMHLVQEKIGRRASLTTGTPPPPPDQATATTAATAATAVTTSATAERRPSRTESPLLPGGLTDFSAIKALDAISDVHREKSAAEAEIKDLEDANKHHAAEVQELQSELERESSRLRALAATREETERRASELETVRAELAERLADTRRQCQNEANLISSLQTQLAQHEEGVRTGRHEMAEAQALLASLRQQRSRLEQEVQASGARLDAVTASVAEAQSEVGQTKVCLTELIHKSERRSIRRSVSRQSNTSTKSCSPVSPGPPGTPPMRAFRLPSTTTAAAAITANNNNAVNNNNNAVATAPRNTTPSGAENGEQPDAETSSLGEAVDGRTSSDHDRAAVGATTNSSPVSSMSGLSVSSGITETKMEENNPDLDDPFRSAPPIFADSSLFSSSDPFKADEIFKDPFKGHDPFKSDPFATDDTSPGFSSDPFGGDPFKDSDPFAASEPEEKFFNASAVPAAAPAGNSSSDNGSAVPASQDDPFSALNSDPFVMTVETSTAPTDSADPFKSNDPFKPGGVTIGKASASDPFATVDGFEDLGFGDSFADFSQMSSPTENLPTEDDNNDGAGTPPEPPPRTAAVFAGGQPLASSSIAVEEWAALEWDAKERESPVVPPRKSKTPSPVAVAPKEEVLSLKRSESRSDKAEVEHKISNTSSPDPCTGVSGVGSDAVKALGKPGSFDDPFAGSDPFASNSPKNPAANTGSKFPAFKNIVSEEDQLAWAKRESERAELERQQRLREQEQEELELAIALSQSESSSTA